MLEPAICTQSRSHSPTDDEQQAGTNDDGEALHGAGGVVGRSSDRSDEMCTT